MTTFVMQCNSINRPASIHVGLSRYCSLWGFTPWPGHAFCILCYIFVKEMISRTEIIIYHYFWTINSWQKDDFFTIKQLVRDNKLTSLLFQHDIALVVNDKRGFPAMHVIFFFLFSFFFFFFSRPGCATNKDETWPEAQILWSHRS